MSQDKPTGVGTPAAVPGGAAGTPSPPEDELHAVTDGAPAARMAIEDTNAAPGVPGALAGELLGAADVPAADAMATVAPPVAAANGGAAADALATAAPPGAAAEGGAAPVAVVARPAWQRRAGIAGALGGVAVAVVLVLAGRSHRADLRAPAAGSTSKAAIRAPEGPALASAGETGVRLTGFVVDGAGLPVAGAEVSAEPEHGALARAPGVGTVGSPDSAESARPAEPPGAAVALASGTAGPQGVASSPAAGSAARVGSAESLRAGGSAESLRAGGSAQSRAGGSSELPAVVVAPLTGADGRFVLGGLAAGRVRVRVTGAGLLPAELRYVPVPSDEARIVVARQVAIEGTVTDGGKPVANAPVALRGDAIGGTIEIRSSATGGFRFANLPEGRYQLFAWQAALAARTVRVARLGAGPFGPVELRLEAAAIVVGRVIDRDEGTGLAAAIELRPSGDDQAPRYARSGGDGVFRIEGVPSGRWIADAFVPGYLSPGGVELDAGHGITDLALARGGTVEGRVLDGDGHPLAGAAVRALTTGAHATEISAEVDRDKLRRFSGRTAAPVPVLAPGSAGGSGDPELVARGELGVMVGPIPPIPPPGAHVAQTAIAIDPSLAGEPPALPVDPARVPIWITGADGVYRIRGLPRGKVTVLAAASGFAEARGPELAIEPGQQITGIDIIATAGTILTGKVTDQHGAPVIGAQLTATPSGAGEAGGASIDAFTDDAGGYRLGPVAGSIELRATAYGHGEARRTMALAAVRGQAPAERREDLVLAVADAAVAGILEDATGAAVAGAQLEVAGGASDGRRTTAATDGTFAIDRLPAGHLRLHITHPAYPSEDVDVVAATGDPGRLRLRLALGGGVEGALLDAASGAALPSVTLAAAGPGNALAEASTDKVGRWKLGPLRPGRWRVAIKLPGYLAYSRELDVPAANAPGGTSVRDILIELARGSLIGGTVRDARGQRIAAAHVVAAAAFGGGPTCEADTDGQGEFRIHDCPTGELAVVATKVTARGTTRTTVRAGDEVLSLALELR